MRWSTQIRKSPFARLLLFYVSGILAAMLFHISGSINNVIILVIPVVIFMITLLMACCYPGYRTPFYSGVVMAFLFFFLGLLGYVVHDLSVKAVTNTAGYQGMAVIEISEPPIKTLKSVKCIARIKYVKEGETYKSSQQRIMVYFRQDPLSLKLTPGTTILAHISLRNVPPPQNPGEFNYRQYLAARRISNQVWLDTGRWTSRDNQKSTSVKAIACNIQEQLLEKYRELGLNNTLYSILSAITLGYKSDLEAHTSQVFSAAGVMHVMALSGFNVAIIAAVAGYLLFFLNRMPPGAMIKTVVVILLIWAFAFVTGLSPSVTRASVMISLVMPAALFRRRINTVNILFASAFLLLALSPALISDISFQLSFAAVAGIIFIYPALAGSIQCRYAITRKIWQLFSVTCSAQLATLPFTLYYFHQFPVYFWLTNLYVIPLVSLIICVSGVFLLISVNGFLTPVFGMIMKALMSLLYSGIAFVEWLPYSVIENIHISGIQAFLLAAAIIAVVLFLLHKKTIILMPALAIMLILQIVHLAYQIQWNRQQIVMVGKIYGSSAIHLISGRNGLLLGNVPRSTHDPALQYVFREFWIRHGVADRMECRNYSDASDTSMPGLAGNKVLDHAGKRVFIMTNDSILKRKIRTPLDLDLLIITGGVEAGISGLLSFFKPDQIILDSSVPFYRAKRMEKACVQNGVTCWNVPEKGAFLYSTTVRNPPHRFPDVR